jgi:hypothetical protein
MKEKTAICVLPSYHNVADNDFSAVITTGAIQSVVQGPKYG